MDDVSAAAPAAGLAPTTIRVLLVDDQAMIGEAIRRMLSAQPDLEFHYASEPAQALAMAHALRPTVILQDLVMPTADGFDLIARYRADLRLSAIPVIVLSAKEDPRLKAHSFAVGASDYLVKLPDRIELAARIRYHSAAYINHIERDQAFQALRESEQKLAAANVELAQLAALDGLTGIANRRRFDQSMQIEWQRGQRERTPLSLLLCDVDFFKLYNDNFGHQGGDLCLKKVASVLTSNLKRPADLAARYGGEEFAVILPQTAAAGALKVARACCQHLENLNLEHPGAADKGVVTMSIGAATLVPSADASVEQLIALADRALYAAKRAGRNRVVNAAELPAEPAPPFNSPTKKEASLMSTQFDNVSVVKKSNIYFDGKCVSHGIVLADGTKKTIGVIFPSSLTFNTGAPEIMELVSGKCKVRLAGASEWNTYEGGQQFTVGANSSFDIETLETLDYVCHFG
jgi:two-component system, chemotaxis family, response regulator WspR